MSDQEKFAIEIDGKAKIVDHGKNEIRILNDEGEVILPRIIQAADDGSPGEIIASGEIMDALKRESE